MAFRATIDVTDHAAPGVCTSYYEVNIRLTGVVDWTPITPFTNTVPLVINGLLAGQTYDVSVRRYSCAGEFSPATTLTVNT